MLTLMLYHDCGLGATNKEEMEEENKRKEDELCLASGRDNGNGDAESISWPDDVVDSFSCCCS